MASADMVLKIAAKELGYHPGSDPSKYGLWLAEQTGESWLAGSAEDISWCALFVSWCFYQAGQELPGAPSAAVADILYASLEAGLGVGVDEMQRGDVVAFDWGDGGIDTDHIGIVEEPGVESFRTIEGNTDDGRVARKERYPSQVLGVVRPPYDDADGFTRCQKLYALYLLGRWETGLTWDSTSYDNYVNYGDAKSIGIMHWTYGSASALVRTMEERAPDLWNALDASWREAGVTGDFEATANFTASAIDKWVRGVADYYDEATAHQTWYWCDSGEQESFDWHVSEMERLYGPMPDRSGQCVKLLMFYMRLQHNMGYHVGEVFAASGGWGATLEDVANNAVYTYWTFDDWPTYGEGWMNATVEIRDRLEEWDGESCPPDFGQNLGYDSSPSGGTGNNGGTDGPASGRYKHIILRGDNLVLYATDGAVYFEKTNGSLWIPRKGSRTLSSGGAAPHKPSQSGHPGGTPGGTEGDGMPGAEDMLTWTVEHEGLYTYHQGYTDCTDIEAPLCDCSGYISRLFWKFAPDVWYKMGGGDYQFSTSQLWEACYIIEEWPEEEPDLLPGDLFFENNQDGATGVVSWGDGGKGHVLIYLGGVWCDVTSDWDGRATGGPYPYNTWDTLVTNATWKLPGISPYWCVSRPPW